MAAKIRPVSSYSWWCWCCAQLPRRFFFKLAQFRNQFANRQKTIGSHLKVTLSLFRVPQYFTLFFVSLIVCSWILWYLPKKIQTLTIHLGIKWHRHTQIDHVYKTLFNTPGFYLMFQNLEAKELSSFITVEMFTRDIKHYVQITIPLCNTIIILNLLLVSHCTVRRITWLTCM